MATILILEDDLALISYWRRVLEEEGHDVICCETVAQALQALSAADVDVIVADMLIREQGRLSTQGGITLANKRASGALKKHIPIIGVSGARPHRRYSPIAPLEIAKTMGIELALYKPITPQVLLEAVDRLLAGRARTQQATL